MRGDSESASKNTLLPIFKCPIYSNIRIFENSLASDLVFVGRDGGGLARGAQKVHPPSGVSGHVTMQNNFQNDSSHIDIKQITMETDQFQSIRDHLQM